MDSNPVLNSVALLHDVLKDVPTSRLANELGADESVINSWINEEVIPSPVLERQLIFFCIRERLVGLLLKHGVRLPSYDIYTPFNFEDEPIGYRQPLKGKLILKNRPTAIGGHKVNFPFGVPASAITGTSKWIEFFAKKGFDILTYKTVRTQEWYSYKHPNWGFVPDPAVDRENNLSDTQIGSFSNWPEDLQTVTMANSFGIPSMPPKEWMSDIQRAKSILSDGQVLIVSVTGTTPSGRESFDYLVNDFVKAASMAANSGADIIELNFSCPNVPNHLEGEVYRSPEDSACISEAVFNKLRGRNIPIFIKIGYLEKKLLQRVITTNRSYIGGVVAINSIPRKVTSKSGIPLFDANRKVAGISGSAIKRYAIEAVKNLIEIRDREPGNHFDVIAVGGVITPSDVETFLNLKADAVLSCTGAWINPNLAIDTRLFVGEVSKKDRKYYTILQGKNKISPRKGVIRMKEKTNYTPDPKDAKTEKGSEEVSPGVHRQIMFDDDHLLDIMEELIKEDEHFEIDSSHTPSSTTEKANRS